MSVELFVIAVVVAVIVTMYVTKMEISIRRGSGMIARDVNKEGSVFVPRPVFLGLLFGFVIGLGIDRMIPAVPSLAITASVLGAGIVGYIDDRRVMGGWYKPLALVGVAIPLVVLGFVGDPYIGSMVWLGVIVTLGAVTVTGNTINMLDVGNGIISSMIGLASLALVFPLWGSGMEYAAILLGVVSLTYYYWHRFPSKVFPGDAGALVLGVAYASIAVTGEVLVIAIVGIMPAIFNSFLFLFSVRKIVEHRGLYVKPVRRTMDGKIVDSGDRRAAVTLVRLLAHKPITEKQLIKKIFYLTLLSCGLAVLASGMIRF